MFAQATVVITRTNPVYLVYRVGSGGTGRKGRDVPDLLVGAAVALTCK